MTGGGVVEEEGIEFTAGTLDYQWRFRSLQ
jgi:hypothetical protein